MDGVREVVFTHTYWSAVICEYEHTYARHVGPYSVAQPEVLNQPDALDDPSILCLKNGENVLDALQPSCDATTSFS